LIWIVIASILHELLRFFLPTVPPAKYLEKSLLLLTWDEKPEAQSFIRDLLAQVF